MTTTAVTETWAKRTKTGFGATLDLLGIWPWGLRRLLWATMALCWHFRMRVMRGLLRAQGLR